MAPRAYGIAGLGRPAAGQAARRPWAVRRAGAPPPPRPTLQMLLDAPGVLERYAAPNLARTILAWQDHVDTWHKLSDDDTLRGALRELYRELGAFADRIARGG